MSLEIIHPGFVIVSGRVLSAQVRIDESGARKSCDTLWNKLSSSALRVFQFLFHILLMRDIHIHAKYADGLVVQIHGHTVHDYVQMF